MLTQEISHYTLSCCVRGTATSMSGLKIRHVLVRKSHHVSTLSFSHPQLNSLSVTMVTIVTMVTESSSTKLPWLPSFVNNLPDYNALCQPQRSLPHPLYSLSAGLQSSVGWAGAVSLN